MGDSVGSGHFFRCLSLAEELTKKKRKIIFITSSKNIKKYIKKNMAFLVLKGKNELERIKECKKLSLKIKFWIFDLPKVNRKYSFHLRKYNSAIIDDLGNMDVYSKFLFNGGIVKKFQKYNYNKNKTKLFLGPTYMILRKKFYENRNSKKNPKIQIKKILLTFGGNDDKDLTSTIVSLINTQKYEITVLLGPTYKFTKKIQQISISSKNIKIISNSKDTSTLFQKFDLVITTPGITVYELACLGIPTILISINEIQHEVAKAFQRIKFGKNFGFWQNNILKLENMIESINDTKTKKDMRISGQKIVDGKGVLRISEIINNFLRN